MSSTAPIPLRRHAPPLWLVKNGDTVVGPVPTRTLLRGITHRQVPPDSFVRQTGWTDWREIEAVREVAALQPQPAWTEARPNDLSPWGGVPRGIDAEPLLRRARDLGEVLLCGLHAAISATGASLGLVHRRRAPFVGLVTSCAHGPGLEERLGQTLRRDDPAVGCALAGRTVFGRPDAGAVERAAADRLGDGLRLEGVLVVPVRWERDVLGIVEMGRCDHGFRLGDVARVEDIADLVLARLEEMLRRRAVGL